MKLLLVEDDELLGKSLQLGFSERNFECQWVKLGKTAIKRLSDQAFEVVVLDLMLPDISGLDVLAKLRELQPDLPVLVLTAMGSVDDRVRGLNRGADDDLVKPFAFAELVARLEALVRRTAVASKVATELKAGPLVLDMATRCAIREGQEIPLTTTEYKLLEFLVRNSNHTVTRRMLCEHLWDANWEGVTNVVEVHINRVRRKIDRGFRKPLIQTVRGIGYVLRTK